MGVLPRVTSMRFVVISAIAASLLVACGGGGSSDPTSSAEPAASTSESPRAQQPTPAEAWKEDEAAPADAPAYVAEDEADSPEAADAEDPGYTGHPPAEGDVAQNESALSTTTG